MLDRTGFSGATKVATITEYGRIMVPASEVEKILGSAGRYTGLKKKPAHTKAELEAMKPELQSAWLQFVRQKRTQRMSKKVAVKKTDSNSTGKGADGRKAAFRRLAGGSSKRP